MLPIFPKSKKLELADKSDIDAYTRRYPPYSDYNFTSLWSWNTKEEMAVSAWHNYLIIRFTDYITGQPFYGCLGLGGAKEVIDLLLARSKKEDLPPCIRLIPDVVAVELREQGGSDFSIIEDEDSRDYILSVDDLATLEGSQLHNQRNLARRFEREHSRARLSDLMVADREVHTAILSLFDTWAAYKRLDEESFHHERAALIRHFAYVSAYPTAVHFAGLFEDGKLIGFGSDEMLHDHFAVSHFQKALSGYKGIYQYLWHKTAERLYAHGAHYFNIEQDLGISGLRTSKRLWHPIEHLRKYTIQREDDVGRSS